MASKKGLSIIEQELKENPYDGKPLGYEFFREEKNLDAYKEELEKILKSI